MRRVTLLANRHRLYRFNYSFSLRFNFHDFSYYLLIHRFLELLQFPDITGSGITRVTIEALSIKRRLSSEGICATRCSAIGGTFSIEQWRFQNLESMLSDRTLFQRLYKVYLVKTPLSVKYLTPRKMKSF